MPLQAKMSISFSLNGMWYWTISLNLQEVNMFCLHILKSGSFVNQTKSSMTLSSVARGEEAGGRDCFIHWNRLK